MKVLHLTNHLNMGGITMYIAKLIPYLNRLGVKAIIFSSGGACESLLEQNGAKIYNHPFKTKSELNPKIYFAIPKVLKIIRDENIDLIHAHTRITQVMAFWVQKITGIPYVTTCHGFFKPRLGRKILPAWGNHVIAISSGVYDHLLEDFKVPKNQAVLATNGVDFENIQQEMKSKHKNDAKKKWGVLPDQFVVSIIARMTGDKGHRQVVEAIQQLSKEHPKISALLVGEGKELLPLKTLVEQAQLTSKIKFCGTVENIYDVLAATDVFVLASTEKEGFGLSIVEAMACKIPVIATDVNSLNRLIKNESTGLLVPPKDSTALAQAIVRLYQDSAFTNQLATAGHAYAAESLTIKRLASDIFKLYEQELNRKAVAQPS